MDQAPLSEVWNSIKYNSKSQFTFATIQPHHNLLYYIVIMNLYVNTGLNGWAWYNWGIWQDLDFLNDAINSPSKDTFFSSYLLLGTKSLIVGGWDARTGELTTSIEFCIFVNLEWISELE